MLNFEIKQLDELTSRQLLEILRARCDVFVVEQNCAYLEIDDIDLVSWHLQGFDGEKLACYCRIIPPQSLPVRKPAIGRVLTVKDFRGKKYGHELMKKAIEFCHQHYPNQPIFISAQTYLLDFYQSLGFVPQGECYHEYGIKHIDMLLN